LTVLEFIYMVTTVYSPSTKSRQIDQQHVYGSRHSVNTPDTFLSFSGNNAIMAVESTKHNLRQQLDTLQKQYIELRQAEKHLRQAEAEKSAILDSLVEHVVYQDNDLHVLWANRAACDSVGMHREDLIGRHCYEIWTQRKSPCTDCPVVKARDSKKPEMIEKETPDGRWWHIQGYPVRDADGDVTGMVELTLDITNAKRAEAKLREKELLFRTVADFAYDWEYWTDPGQTYLYVSPSCKRITGYAPEAFFHDPELLERITHPEDRATISKHIHEEMENQMAYHVDFRIITRSGEVRWIGHLCRPVFDADGRYLGRRSSNRDITERKMAEQALRKSEEKFRQIVNTAHEGIYVLDSDGKITFVNRQMANMIGYGVEEMHGRYLGDFIDDITSVENCRDHCTDEENRQIPQDLHFRCKGDSDFWGMVSSSPIYDEDGRFTGALGMVADVTERKKAELAVRQANSELKAFIDTVSHDLKSPIISTEILCNLLSEKYGDRLDAKGRRYLQLISASTSQMSRLVSDLLDLSRIGQVVPNLKNVDFSALVNDVVAKFQGIIGDGDMELVVSHDFPTIYCDAERMQQVLDNLLANAVRFARSADKPRVEVGYEDAGNYHRCYVSDNGVGIDGQHHRKIFDAFQRIAEKGNEEGTGLGLTIVQRLVEQHRGKVWVESEKGKGATFYFTLPK